MEKVVLTILLIAGFLAVVSAFIFAFTRQKDERSYSVRMGAFVVVLTFVLATSGLIVAGRMFYFHGVRNVAPPATAQMVFTSQTYDLQSGLFSLEGSVWGLGPGRELWVVFRGEQSDRLFPAQTPCEILSENRFSCSRISTGALNPSKPTGTRQAGTRESADGGPVGGIPEWRWGDHSQTAHLAQVVRRLDAALLHGASPWIGALGADSTPTRGNQHRRRVCSGGHPER